jgi:3-carboxy-cis,cis-muconate cycloisomerase
LLAIFIVRIYNKYVHIFNPFTTPMTSSLIDSRFLGDLFSTPLMRDVFTDTSQIARYIDVEIALARAQGKLDVIPIADADAIARYAHHIPLDMTKLAIDTHNVGYPILPLVTQLAAGLGEAGRSLHWGATTQDIMDTACVLQVRQALDLLEPQILLIAKTLRDLARKHQKTPMAGRTHLQHALPVTLGYKAVIWLGMLERHLERLAQLRPRVLVLSFAGAAGTLASLGSKGLAVQEQMAIELGLSQPVTTWHTARDGLAECLQWLGLVTASLAKIAVDVSLMMSNELAEVFEPYVHGRGASSTMPQKRNPISCEVIIGCAKAVRHSSALMLDAMVQDMERATGPWQAEWVAIPEAFMYSAGAIEQARLMLQGLIVDEQRMLVNLQSTGGLIVAEALMMGLATHLGRNAAHELVYEACRTALETRQSLADVLITHPSVTAHMNAEQIYQLCNPANYLGSAPQMVSRALSIYPSR